MKKYLFLLLTILLFSCGSEEQHENNNIEELVKQIDKEGEPDIPIQFDEVDFEEVDFDMDITKLSLSEIRILRNSFYAKQGYCFMKADLRGYFSTTDWYEKRMETRWWAENEQGGIEPISFNEQEQRFIDKLMKREEELKRENFRIINNQEVANLNNIVNLFQLEEANPELIEMLGKNGFAIVPNDNIQLFHVYEQNDYQQFPNFVTTDMYMQLFHMYFGYILRTIEEQKFIGITAQLCKDMITEMKVISFTETNSAIIEMAQFNQTYYSIAYTLLTKTRVEVPYDFQDFYEEELNQIDEAIDAPSRFLDYKDVHFPYSLFKPRGHYTRTEGLKRYFKTMMWLQTAPFCLDKEKYLKKAILSASVLSKNKKIMQNYKALLKPISFIIGEPDNVSFLDLANLLKGKLTLEELLNKSNFARIKSELEIIAKSKNKINPKPTLSCKDKINFIPQRYVADNKILQDLVDLESILSKRAYPKGLDVMAAFGSVVAEKILLEEIGEGKKWKEYPERLNALKGEMKEIDWEASVYNKWIESLLALQQTENTYPYFMQTDQWKKKDLNASLASWAELKHDAILYAEQPMAAECGGGGPPSPYTVGYVEPNINYWNKVIELIELTEEVLANNNLMTDDISRITTSLQENAQFLLSASKKELSGETLSEQEYRQIEYIGSTFEWLTLDLVKQKDEHLDGWHNVKGPDKSVAVIADVYTANSENNPNKGILHVGTGNVNDIYVVVEIEGYLYLTKGAVFSYYEFSKPMGTRLTDEEWQNMLKNNQEPDLPSWINEIILQIEPPKSNEKIFYSSGC